MRETTKLVLNKVHNFNESLSFEHKGFEAQDNFYKSM